MRRVFTFDVDGVVAGGEFLPILGRTRDAYGDCTLIDPEIPSIINRLAYRADVYFISARGFQDATLWTRLWLTAKGIDLEFVAGVICNVPLIRKPAMCNLLHATYHFDDDIATVLAMPTIGVAVENKLGGTQVIPPHIRAVHSWKEIEQMCAVPKSAISLCPQQSFFDFAA